MRERILRIAAARDKCTDKIADRESGHIVPDGDDLARDFEPGNVRRAWRRIVQPLALEHVGTVHAGCMNADQHFVVGRCRNSTPHGYQHVRAAGLRDFYRGHLRRNAFRFM